ncbi:hypothetical protein HYS91_02190 [Candidatus Daviesbacteria bacterium]|nr:hypothetical protein [Candidatus Daviesbacteria bacterium]
MFILAVIALMLVLINSIVLIGGALTFKQSASYSIDSTQALNLAEAGIDKAVASMNTSAGSYSGEETNLGNGTYIVSVIPKNSTTSIIESTGYIPNKTNPKSKKTIRIEMSKGVGVAFNYGVQVGDGGLYMEQQGTIDGSLYSNGNAVIDQQSEILGDVYVAGGTQPTADQEHECVPPNCSDFLFGKNFSGQNIYDVAQSFKPSQTQIINKVGLKIKKFGNPQTATVKILSDSGDNPDRNNVLASGTIQSNLVTSQYSFIDVTFTSSPTLTAGTTYWIMIDTSGNTSSNYWAWELDTLAGYTCSSTPPCLAKWSTGSSTWNTISGDLGFKVYMGGVINYIKGANMVKIAGDAHANTLIDLGIGGGAYYQSAQNITAGSLHPGSSDPQPLPMPISQGNIDEWKDQADENIYTGDITNCPSVLNSGKYVGNVTLPDLCSVTVYSPVWITGNFYMDQQSKIRLDSSYGASSGVFITDGTITMEQQNHIQGSCWQDTCTNGSYLFLISEFNSRDDPEGDYAIHVQQQGNTGVLYSNLGTIRVEQQNDFTEITAWKISLGQQIDITYDQGLAGAFFSSGPGGSYSVVKGTYQEK